MRNIEFENKYPDLLKECFLYITGSQGVAPCGMTVRYGDHYQDEKSLCRLFDDLIDENAFENIDNYLDDCDGDEDEAQMEAVVDSGEFQIFLNEDDETPVYIYDGGLIKYENILL